jgi:hypothetical protein
MLEEQKTLKGVGGCRFSVLENRIIAPPLTAIDTFVAPFSVSQSDSKLSVTDNCQV